MDQQGLRAGHDLGPFVQILTDARMIAAFGDDTTALMMYDAETIPVKSAPGAKCVAVNDGKITYSRFVFDRAPFEAARKASAPSAPGGGKER